jgi:hypothetical protein
MGGGGGGKSGNFGIFDQNPCGVLSAFLVGYFHRFNYENAHFPVSWRMCQIRAPKSHISSATAKVSKLFGHLIDQNPYRVFN